MPKQVIFALLIESALIVLTCLLLAQPDLIFAGQSERLKSFARAGGLLLLCLTFCWSVVFGMVMAFHSISFRI